MAPLPAVLVTCGTNENPFVLTVAWTGICSTHPPVCYISVRKSRNSYDIIKSSGEFAINLTTAKMCRTVDRCGVKSGKNTDKFADCKIETVPAKNIACPLIADSPLSLECKVHNITELGTHDMFLADIIGVAADERYIDENGKLNLESAHLLSYAHGDYFELGKKLGTFGWSVRKKKRKQLKNKSRSE